MFHEYARERGWKNPTDAKDTSMMFAYKTDKDMFAYQQELGYGPHFNVRCVVHQSSIQGFLPNRHVRVPDS